MSKTFNSLFLELACPDEEGKSRWVSVNEFVGKYEKLKLGNGGSWTRADGSLAKKYIVLTDKSITPGNRIDRIKLDGLNPFGNLSQNIRPDIKEKIRGERCVVLGISLVEVDHKDGRKDDPRVMNPKTQRPEDFQPLSKAANTAKRQFCKDCKRTDRRFDATSIGYPVSFTEGGETYEPALRCRGCYWHDPKDFRSKVYFIKWKKKD